MAEEKDNVSAAPAPKVVKGKIQGKLLQRHPAFEDAVPGEVVEFDAKHLKSFEGVVDTHEDAVANPTITRDSDGNVNDLELNKQLAAEKAKAAKKKNSN
jgi:hypothetical protein